MKLIFSKSFQEFLSETAKKCKIANILDDYARYENNADKLTDLFVNYITFRKDGNISYLPVGKEHKVNEDTGEWLRDGRQDGKAAKVIRKLFTKEAITNFTDSDFECFSNSYKANFSDDGFELKLLSNKDIPGVYDMERGEGEGSLQGSCMNNDSSYLDIYRCCKQLQILILVKDDKLYGRSLIWKIDDNITLMDRIYVTKDFMYEKFLDYAKEQKLWKKEHYKTYDYKTSFVNPSGEKVVKSFYITTDVSHDSFPYIDTFQYGDDDSINNFGDGHYVYNCTGGERSGGERSGGEEPEDEHEGEEYDDINDEYIDSDDAIYIEHGSREYRGRTTHIDNTIETEDGHRYHENDIHSYFVEINDRYYDLDSDDITTVDDEYVLIDDCLYCERDDQYYLSEDCVEDKEGNYILRSEAVMVNSEWIHEDDVEDFSEVEILGANQEVCDNPNQIKLFTEKA